MVKRWYKAGEAADYLGVSYHTLRTYVAKGKLDYRTTPGGQKIYSQTHLDSFLGKKIPDEDNNKIIVFYARDSKGNQSRIDRQKERLETTYGKPIKTYQDKASGLNEKRPGLKQMMADARKGKFNTVAITAKDRLTRFGFSYLEEFFFDHSVNVVVLDDQKQDKNIYDELLQDFMSLVASFSGKFYRLRSLKHEKMLLDLAQEELIKNADD